MQKRPDLIAERAFFVNGKRNGGPAVIFRLWRPHQSEADYPRCRYELTSKGSKIMEVPGIDVWIVSSQSCQWPVPTWRA